MALIRVNGAAGASVKPVLSIYLTSISKAYGKVFGASGFFGGGDFASISADGEFVSVSGATVTIKVAGKYAHYVDNGSTSYTETIRDFAVNDTYTLSSATERTQMMVKID